VRRLRLATLIVCLCLLTLTDCDDCPTAPEYPGWQFLGLEDHEMHTLALDWPNLYAGGPGVKGGLFKAGVTGGRPEWEDLGLQAVHDMLVLETGRLLVASNLGMLRSDDGGHTWSRSDSGMIAHGGVLCMTQSDEGIYAGSRLHGMFKSTNNGASWTSVSEDASLLYIELACNSELMLARGTTYGGQVVRISRDQGITWQQLPTSALLGQVPRSLAASPSDDHVAYIGLDKGMLKTADGGESWFAILHPETHGLITALSPDPEVAGHCFVAENGPPGNPDKWAAVIYRTTDGGNTVTPLNDPNIRFISDLQFDGERSILFVSSLIGVYKYHLQ
jgi:photosystem II stability/assembly factor-like uncharacterized protein